MKKRHLLLCLSFLFALSLNAENAKNKKEKKGLGLEYYQKLIESKNFIIDINSVLPSNGMNTHRFNPSGEIKFNDTVTKVHLPYFGKVYNHTPGEDGGIVFESRRHEETIKSIVKKRNKHILYSFTADGRNDKYKFYIRIFGNGSANVDVSSNHKSPITYIGDIEEIREKDKK